ncbi:hypothetical protein ABID22_000299 [Pontibacter aydingkolensis]|uniref:Uncharacterized protein n=1 Tax=Pontibacter aydingkolensis TaxID=1911536 RepID=A0ABS7CQF3_9BACT|nr:hypothetical protein [Pontibacter aydingkolensis]MBW7466035.1 hypothetical protein [Pontibacter aydingkolensis]
MKKFFRIALSPLRAIGRGVVKPFQSKYEVVCTNYHVIPGMPVNKNQQVHAFERGAALEAREFYVKVVSSEMTRTMAPVEVQLRKIYLRGKTMEQKQFGPVEQLKSLNAKKK